MPINPPQSIHDIAYEDMVHDFMGSRVKFSINKVIQVIPVASLSSAHVRNDANTDANAKDCCKMLSAALPHPQLNNVNNMPEANARIALQALVTSLGIATPVVFGLPKYQTVATVDYEITPANPIYVFVEGSNQLSALYNRCHQGANKAREVSNLVPICTIATLADSATSLINEVYNRRIRFIKGAPMGGANTQPTVCSGSNIQYIISGEDPIALDQMPGVPGSAATPNVVTPASYATNPDSTIYFFNGHANFTCNGYFGGVAVANRFFPDLANGYDPNTSGPSLKSLAANITGSDPTSRKCYDVKRAGDWLQLSYFAWLYINHAALFAGNSFLLTFDVICAHIGRYVFNVPCLSINGGNNTNYVPMQRSTPAAGILAGGGKNKKYQSGGFIPQIEDFSNIFTETVRGLWTKIRHKHLHRIFPVIEEGVIEYNEQQWNTINTYKYLDAIDIAFEEACNILNNDGELTAIQPYYYTFIMELFAIPNNHPIIALLQMSSEYISAENIDGGRLYECIHNLRHFIGDGVDMFMQNGIARVIARVSKMLPEEKQEEKIPENFIENLSGARDITMAIPVLDGYPAACYIICNSIQRIVIPYFIISNGGIYDQMIRYINEYINPVVNDAELNAAAPVEPQQVLTYGFDPSLYEQYTESYGASNVRPQLRFKSIKGVGVNGNNSRAYRVKQATSTITRKRNARMNERRKAQRNQRREIQMTENGSSQGGSYKKHRKHHTKKRKHRKQTKKHRKHRN